MMKLLVLPLLIFGNRKIIKYILGVPPVFVASGAAVILASWLGPFQYPLTDVFGCLGALLAGYGFAVEIWMQYNAFRQRKRDAAERAAQEARKQALLNERRVRRETRASERAAMIAATQARASHVASEGAQMVRDATSRVTSVLSETGDSLAGHLRTVTVQATSLATVAADLTGRMAERVAGSGEEAIARAADALGEVGSAASQRLKRLMKETQP